MLLCATFLVIHLFVVAMSVPRMVLFNVWRSEDKGSTKPLRVLSRVFEFLDLQESTESDRRYIKKISDNFCAKLKEKWIKSRRILNKFLIKNSTWLKGDVLFPKLNIFSWNAQFQIFRR